MGRRYTHDPQLMLSHRLYSQQSRFCKSILSCATILLYNTIIQRKNKKFNTFRYIKIRFSQLFAENAMLIAGLSCIFSKILFHKYTLYEFRLKTAGKIQPRRFLLNWLPHFCAGREFVWRSEATPTCIKASTRHSAKSIFCSINKEMSKSI